MNLWKKLAGITLASVLAFSFAGAAAVLPARAETAVTKEKADEAEPAAEEAAEKEVSEAAEETEKNGEVYILFTSDVHCGIDEGFGFAGLQQIRDNLEAQGCTTILVDNGDGQTAFAGCSVLQEEVMLDNETLIRYIEDTLGGEIGEEYADPYGDGRITIIEAQE